MTACFICSLSPSFSLPPVACAESSIWLMQHLQRGVEALDAAVDAVIAEEGVTADAEAVVDAVDAGVMRRARSGSP